MNKITCICLGVRNMEKSIQFYKGWVRVSHRGGG